MIRNYFLTTFRHLRKHSGYAVINILGLSIGITCSLILFLLVKFWVSFDNYHADAENIYRIVRENKRATGPDYSSGVPIPFPEAFRNDFPEVKQNVFISSMSYSGTLFTITDQLGNTRNFKEEEHIALTEPSFFDIFYRPIVHGSSKELLSQPNEIVLSEKIARKYFPGEDAVGKTIVMNKKRNLVVKAVMEDYPDNTNFPFDIFISWATVKQERPGSWGSVNSDDELIIKLTDNQRPEDINKRLEPFVTKYFGEERTLDSGLKEYLQPLSDIHYEAKFGSYADQTISRQMLWILSIAAGFLIFIACVNFINLATATALKRAKEVGVRKVLGGSYGQLMGQFLGETFIITIVSMLIALGLTEILLIQVNNFLETNLELNLISDPVIFLFVVGVTILISLVSGLYPAWVQARFNPINAFKLNLKPVGGQKFSLRKSLIVFQFIIAQVFIIGTLVLFKQMQYVRYTDLGFQHEATLDLRLPESTLDRKRSFRNTLQQLPTVEKVSLAFSNPASGWLSMTDYMMKDEDERKVVQVKAADSNFFDLFQIPVIAGEGLRESDSLSHAVVNEAFIKSHGWKKPEEAVGKVMELWGNDIPIVGVVADFHTQSLKESIEPTIIVDNVSSFDLVAVKLQTSNLQAGIKDLEKSWNTFFPEYDFEYRFVDEEIEEFYESEQKLADLITVASMVIIFIGCLGMYGLVTFMAEQKTKEVGVRKVLGASVYNIVGIFSWEFIKLILIAFLIAAPLAYFFMNIWLQNFEFRIPLGIDIFLLGIFSTLFIALATVSYRSIKAALVNPVKSLKSD